MAEDKDPKNDAVGLFLRAMVDREPGKRRVKPSKTALFDFADLDLGESSDDSDFNVDEAKLHDDDDISINSDPEDDGEQDDESDDDDDDEDESENNDGDEIDDVLSLERKGENLSVQQLLERAKEKQEKAAEQGFERPKIFVCAVCLGDHSDDTNEIVTCDGCRVSVHEGCYGISDTISVSSTVSSCSTEPWFCDACKAGADGPPCELCPNLGYTIFKETEMGRWVHLVCALYVPGVAFSEVDKLCFPTLFEMPYSRWGAKMCSLCEDERYSKTGVCIGCDAGMCRSYFHVTCAQREGLLSEVNHGEADQADPYYAHCKLHSDKELIRKRKRNWLALQLHMKQGEADRLNADPATLDRTERKLRKYRDKYCFHRSTRPRPWFPTQKIARSLSTCASLFRSLLHKTKLMGINTEAPAIDSSLGDIRKKWHIPPAFSIEFISYYLDRMTRLKDMKYQLDSLLKENSVLTQEENKLREKFTQQDTAVHKLKSENEILLKTALDIHNIMKGLAGRPLPLPQFISSLHNPPVQESGQPCTKERRMITKGAAKMVSDQVPSPRTKLDSHQSTKGSIAKRAVNVSGDSGVCTDLPLPSKSTIEDDLRLNVCSVCKSTVEQHLLIQCDTCQQYYHLGCLDPPLTRMPKKTKQMGWQCSDCCKSSDSEKLPDFDPSAPRQLRRMIKEPNKLSSKDLKDNKVTSGQAELKDPSPASKKRKIVAKGREPVSTKRTKLGEGVGCSKKIKDASDAAEDPCDVSMQEEKESASASEPQASCSISEDVVSEKNCEESLCQNLMGNNCEEMERAPDVHKMQEESDKQDQCASTPSGLDMSAESLPSASSLHSPLSESLQNLEDDSLSPRKEKRHRDGSKKKKKDKDKEDEGGKKRKKHHHRQKHGTEMASEILTPVRIKIKPLPPRPNYGDYLSYSTSSNGEEGATQNSVAATQPVTSPPPGYPPLPPGYTLTQPMIINSTSSTACITSTVTCLPVQVSDVSKSVDTSSGSVLPATSSFSRRRSEGQEQQFSKCDVCGETGGVTNTVFCDECLKAYHFNCLEPPLKKSPKRRGYSWFCEDCHNGTSTMTSTDSKSV